MKQTHFGVEKYKACHL